MPVKYDKRALSQHLLGAAREAAGELTRVFFSSVDTNAPVESGHLHQTLGTAVGLAGLVGAEPAEKSLLSKGSQDPEATSRAYGSTTVGEAGLTVLIGTSVGFVNRLDDGDTFEPDVNGSKGFKTSGKATTGVLYGPRNSKGPVGFLMWYSGGGQYFTRSHNWGPLGFFEDAAVALRSKAQEMGLT